MKDLPHSYLGSSLRPWLNGFLSDLRESSATSAVKVFLSTTTYYANLTCLA
jgi:hypothetical protein